LEPGDITKIKDNAQGLMAEKAIDTLRIASSTLTDPNKVQQIIDVSGPTATDQPLLRTKLNENVPELTQDILKNITFNTEQKKKINKIATERKTVLGIGGDNIALLDKVQKHIQKTPPLKLPELQAIASATDAKSLNDALKASGFTDEITKDFD